MLNSTKNGDGWLPFLDDEPANQVRPAPEEHYDLLVARRAFLQSAINSKSRGTSPLKSRGGRGETGHARVPQALSFILALRIRRPTTGHDVERETRNVHRQIGKLNRPDRPANTWELSRVCDLFVSKELSPRAVR